MVLENEDIGADIGEPPDRREPTFQMEPLLVSDGSRWRGPLNDLAVDLAAKAAGFRSSLMPTVRTELAQLVRAMNCYYSNLIEGHDTHPVDIERALRNDYSTDPVKRDLQLEARAHISVQAWIDSGGLRGRAATQAGIREMHRRFCEHLPDDMLWVEEPNTHERLRVVAGEIRRRDVQVGRHVAVSPGAVPRFLERFESVYARLGRTDAILATAAAHHRLLWIHPFIDGNGRVSRLMSHAMLLDALETGGVWSVARGLARNVERYKLLLAECDLQRRNDLDGRGNLSEEALASFTRFFLEMAIDQVEFMERLVQPERLRTRISMWAEEEARLGALPPRAGALLEALLYRGELPRGEVADVLGVTTRHAHRIAKSLVDRDVLVSSGPRAPYTLAFPAALAGRWMPGLFPEQTQQAGI